ncbi:NAD-dependent epimerase/dehydratase family protein [Acidobacteriota bacterium]
MKAVVFGGSGFLGSHVADALTEKKFNVTIFDNVESPYISSDQQMIVGDILNPVDVEEAVKGSDYVFNFAGIADIDEANENPIAAVQNNILGNTFILESCYKNEVKRFVFASTIYVYSDLGGVYRSSKQACELIIENYQKLYGLDFTILRYGSLYGKRANNFNFVNKIINQALIEGKISRKGDGEEIRDYINVVDAARCSVEVLKDEFANQHVIIKGTQTIKIKDFLSMIKEILGNTIEIEYSSERIPEHYEITPYNFKPKVAKNLIMDYFHDLGQGILEVIYDVYNQLDEKDVPMKIPFDKSSS